jgi:HEPN domain-containing protein
MSFNPLSEVRYRYRLALEHLERAEKLFLLRDWVGTMSACQLAAENFAKAIIAVFEVPTWSHDPSNQLSALTEKLPIDIVAQVKELVTFAREMAPEHSRSGYGEPSAGLLPSDIYREEHASNALRKGKKVRKVTEKVLKSLNVSLRDPYR